MAQWDIYSCCWLPMTLEMSARCLLNNSRSFCVGSSYFKYHLLCIYSNWLNRQRQIFALSVENEEPKIAVIIFHGEDTQWHLCYCLKALQLLKPFVVCALETNRIEQAYSCIYIFIKRAEAEEWKRRKICLLFQPFIIQTPSILTGRSLKTNISERVISLLCQPLEHHHVLPAPMLLV